ncbi:MAG TPA: peptidylprolyl isomerase [Bacteroidales bacterium]|nr:MAG: peptidylprolyl isomerase [Bacteroidetes bacterium GWE2_42_24]OFY32066.1 MAG: peptidylprolyl isomerase [Bacteroidetes bacterium GWF2_43_11]PKP25829.1 MAG: peptidylprolyl isomerase [Bacteroidetes bacterium HGW-Bacteroidetes-22]HBZ66334.1 peptidylprolyl isomerase [Bacteroidales bacterium]
MQVSKNKVVSLTYTLRLNDEQGELVQETGNDQPLVFIYGSGMLLPAFESNIVNLKTKDLFSFGLPASDAYGDFNPNAVIDLDINIFKEDGKLNEELVQIGNTIPMQDSEGNRMDGVVVELTDTNVKMDFNHPLAGKDLHFSGEIVELREASSEELAHGHVHGPHDHHH